VRRFVGVCVLMSAVAIAFAAAPLGAVVSNAGVRAGVIRVAPAKKQKSKTKSKAVTFTVTGTFEGKTYNGKASSTTVRCYPSGDFFNAMWAGTVGGSQFSINFGTRTGATPASNANTASLIVNNDQQNGLGADTPTITLTSTQKSGAFDGQFVEAGSTANSIHIKGPFKCTAQ
jgi:hypothetical protein